jgi:competence ComEA-like helix-hairpin-helix protein
LVLCIILIFIITAKFIITNHKDKSKYDFSKFENDIDSFLSYQDNTDFTTELFYFDPNTISDKDLNKLGLSAKAINSICNYREKGGKFYKAEDVRKIYNISEEEYLRIKDYIIIENKNNSTKKQQNIYYSNLFEFDPNIATGKDFEILGLNSWQIENILKYRKKGGTFKSSEDFGKIYGIDKKTYEKLKSFIRISPIEQNENTTYLPDEKSIIINLNTATENELQTLKGIGPAFSKRIIEYREKLGGYYTVDQLIEVYGFSEDLLSSIREYIRVDPDNIKKINLNTAEYKELISHPYINKDYTVKILNYRNFAGKIESFEELLKQKAIDENFYIKLSPYFITE